MKKYGVVPIPLQVPHITQSDIDAVSRVLSSGMLVCGEESVKVEAELCEILQVSHAMLVSSGTAALHLALLSAGLKPGQEVIVPAFSFAATANSVELAGLKPVFVDIDADTLNLDTSHLVELIGTDTGAVMPVHQFGMPADLNSLIDVAKQHELAIIEDAACALGACYEGEPIGSHGNLCAFSFHPRKPQTCGEGGLVTTNESDAADRIRCLRNHGIRPGGQGPPDFVSAGLNYRLTDFQAAMLGSQLQRAKEYQAKRANLASIYLQELSDTCLTLPIARDGCTPNWQSFHVTFPNASIRQSVWKEFSENKVGCNYGATCIPRLTYYSDKYGLRTEDFPNASRAFDCGLVLPLYDLLEDDDIRFICKLVKSRL